MTIINWDLLKHPFNWIIVVLMVMIAGAFFHFLALHLQSMNATSQGA